MLRRKILINTLANSGGKALSFAFQLIIVSYLVKRLGAEAYGSVVLALALAANVQLLEGGFGIGVTKYIAEFNIKGDKNKLLEIVNTNIIVTTVFAVAFALIVAVINEFLLAEIFSISLALLADTKKLIWILIATSAIEFWSVSIIRVAEGFQRYFTVRLIEVLKWALRMLFIVLAVEKGYGLAGVGYAYFAAGAITMLLLYVSIFARDPNLKINPFLGSRKTFTMLFGFSIWMSISKVSAFLSYRIDVILIGVFLSPVFVAYYDIAFKIYEALKFSLYVIASALVPVSSELGSMNDKRRLEMLFRKVSKYTLAFILPQLVFAIIYAENIIALFVGVGVEAAGLTRLFATSLFFLALASSGAEILVGLDKVKGLAICGGIAAVINLVISVILVKTIGVSGPVIGTIVGTIILSVGRLYLMLPLFDISIGDFLRTTLLKPVVGTVALAVVISIFASKNLYVGMAIVMFYMVFLIFTVIDKNDRREFIKAFR